uniref:Uncharacterized protein n=1 Tax=Physcomitrium patens TaxID=3218 RepID=A0A2K1L0T6_PHYPA|nr:hypothetical protein PHYPA_002430 [Physcomitrium patens]
MVKTIDECNVYECVFYQRHCLTSLSNIVVPHNHKFLQYYLVASIYRNCSCIIHVSITT